MVKQKDQLSEERWRAIIMNDKVFFVAHPVNLDHQKDTRL